MKIIHPSGQAYDLNIDTQLELTRYNPFFHDKGEQSIPITLPASDHNLALLQHPESTAGKQKIAQRLNATIQSGVFSVNARQAILSARKNDSIETSFYLSEGAFYEKIKDITLQEIFKDRSLEFANIDATIEFMRTLGATNDSRFACFQVVTDTNHLNSPWGSNGFANEIETIEVIDDKKITIPKGFYITPFVKVRHILEETLAYFGYTLGASFLDNAPFRDMCFLNDTIDSIVSNKIDYSSIVPNITASTLFDIIRKFNVEFVPDEQFKVMKIIMFNALIDSPTHKPLDDFLVSDPKVGYPTYKKLQLTSNHDKLPLEFSFPNGLNGRKIQKTGVVENGNASIESIVKQYPTAYIRRADGAVVRDGFKGNSYTLEVLGNLSFDHLGTGELEVYNKAFPDTIPATFTEFPLFYYGATFTYPYVGKGRALHSTIILSDSDVNEDTTSEHEDISSNVPELKPMLCFTYKDPQLKLNCGTLSNYSMYGYKLWDYTLFYNGADGIYERFWRKRDNLLRNALREIEADLLLTEDQKFSISTMNKVLLNGQSLIMSELDYTPESNSVESCKLLTTKLQEPISTAKTETDYFPTRLYTWELKYTTSWIPKTGIGQAFRYKSEPIAFYPPAPTEAQYNAGGKYFQKVYDVDFGTYHTTIGDFVKKSDETLTVWLTPILA